MISLIFQIAALFVVAMLLAAWVDHKTRHWAAVFRVALGLLIGLLFGIGVLLLLVRDFFSSVHF